MRPAPIPIQAVSPFPPPTPSPSLSLPQNKTVGIIGAGRIGAAYARMMVEGHKMNLVYYDPYPNAKLEAYIKQYGELLRHNGEPPVYCKRLATVEEVLKEADVSYKTA